MRKIEGIALAVLASAMASGSALAADLITIPTSTPVEMPLHENAGFDWNGFYAGVMAGGQQSPAGETQYALGAQAGVNAQFEFYLLGAEVAVHGLGGGAVDTSYGQILGRAGLVVTDDLVVYAAGGYGIDLGAPDEQDALFGGGVELAVTDSMSLRGQYLHGFSLEGENPKDQFTLGANFHF